MDREAADVKAKTIWTPLRMAALISIWSLVTPFRVQITQLSGMGLIPSSVILEIWAGAWGYGSVTPWARPPHHIVIDPIYTYAMFPYYSIGLAIAYLVWRWAQKGDLTKMQYIDRVLLLQLAHVLFVLILFPCPYSSGSVITCVPTPTTGLFAIPFVKRVVREISLPWQDI
ncbi:MAG: hypothetical protein ACFFER_13530 [Candidatus Thorarchaeota archaeon]